MKSTIPSCVLFLITLPLMVFSDHTNLDDILEEQILANKPLNQAPALQLATERLQREQNFQSDPSGAPSVNQSHDVTLETDTSLTIIYEYDVLTDDGLTDDAREIETYDQNGLLIQYTHQNYTENGVPTNNRRRQYHYDTDLNLIEYIQEVSSGSQWTNNIRTIYSYFPGNMLASSISYRWYDNQWMLSSRSFNSFDNEDLLNERLVQEYENESWVNQQRSLYDYTTLNELSYIYRYIWVDEDWLALYGSFYTYYPDGNLHYSGTSDWQNNEWQAVVSKEYSYDLHDNLLLVFGRSHYDDEWVNSSLANYSYDIGNNQTGRVYQNWVDSTWNYTVRDTFFYDVMNRLTRAEHSEWYDQVWVNNEAYDVFYYPRFSNPELSLQPIDIYAFHGDTLSIDVHIDLSDTLSVNAIEFMISPTDTSLQFLGLDTSNTLLSELDWMVESNDSLGVSIAAAGVEALHVRGLLLRLKYLVLDAAPDSLQLQITNVFLNENTTEITTLGTDIHLLFLQPGDVSLDGFVHAYDATLILQYLAGLDSLSEEQLEYANVSSDTTVSAYDAALILRYIVGTIDALPYNSQEIPNGYVSMPADIVPESEAAVLLPIRFQNANGAHSFHLVLRYDEAVLQFTGTHWQPDMEDFNIAQNADVGVINISGARTRGGINQDLLGFFEFQIRTDNTADTTRLFLDHLQFNEMFVRDSIYSSKLRIHPVSIAQAGIPETFSIQSAYPNPFNPSTTIAYGLPVRSTVTLNIFNLLGQVVFESTVSSQEPGYHTFHWNGTNQKGRQLQSGLYLVVIRTGDSSGSIKTILMK